jgi:hypothetical protein
MLVSSSKAGSMEFLIENNKVIIELGRPINKDFNGMWASSSNPFFVGFLKEIHTDFNQ